MVSRAATGGRPEWTEAGRYRVVVHVGFALATIDADEARALFTMLDVGPATGRAVT